MSLAVPDASSSPSVEAIDDFYTGYIKASDEVANGAAEVSLLDPYVTAEQLKREADSVQSLEQRGLRLEGSTHAYGVRVQDADATHVVFYACLDISESRTIDAKGVDVTSSERIVLQPIIASLRVLDGTLKLESHDSWAGENFC